MASALASLSAGAGERDVVPPDAVTLRLVIERHRFTPEILHAPAGKMVVIELENRDDTPEEFESRRLRKEFGLRGHQSGRFVIKPHPAGRYEFVGEFHAQTAHGALIIE
ncbi:MAG: cupredoxin domain-containing protein [Pseudomonadota bacterium]|nr:cupredoxin domain-containing protein [Pseudomonadota bacterium]